MVEHFGQQHSPNRGYVRTFNKDWVILVQYGPLSRAVSQTRSQLIFDWCLVACWSLSLLSWSRMVFIAFLRCTLGSSVLQRSSVRAQCTHYSLWCHHMDLGELSEPPAGESRAQTPPSEGRVWARDYLLSWMDPRKWAVSGRLVNFYLNFGLSLWSESKVANCACASG